MGTCVLLLLKIATSLIPLLAGGKMPDCDCVNTKLVTLTPQLIKIVRMRKDPKG